jgi:hypothetical protein
MVKYNWKCPYNCKRKREKPNRRHKARRVGKAHLKRKHNDFISEPILIKEGE